MVTAHYNCKHLHRSAYPFLLDYQQLQIQYELLLSMVQMDLHRQIVDLATDVNRYDKYTKLNSVWNILTLIPCCAALVFNFYKKMMRNADIRAPLVQW